MDKLYTSSFNLDDWYMALMHSTKRLVSAYIPEDEEALKNTPERVASAFEEMLGGYDYDSPLDCLGTYFENSPGEDLVLIKDIQFYSLCKHHLLPFFGKVHIGYLPDKKIVGLSKIPRLVKCFSQRLQLQEKLGKEILDCLNESDLKPKGVIVVIEAQHMCMAMRGVEAMGSSTVTSSIVGSFSTDQNLKLEFYHLIGRKI
jgi:GTP cyclohydrolase I